MLRRNIYTRATLICVVFWRQLNLHTILSEIFKILPTKIEVRFDFWRRFDSTVRWTGINCRTRSVSILVWRPLSVIERVINCIGLISHSLQKSLIFFRFRFRFRIVVVWPALCWNRVCLWFVLSGQVYCNLMIWAAESCNVFCRL